MNKCLLDDKQRIIYEMRANSLRGKVSKLDEVGKKGKYLEFFRYFIFLQKF